MFGKLKSMFTKTVFLPHPGVVFPEPSVKGRELPAEGYRGQMKLGIIIGHDRVEPGAKMAAPYGIYEYFFNTDLATRMAAYAAKRCPNMTVEIFARNGVGIAGAYENARQGLCDAVVELHFDAYNTKAKGTTTLCTADANDVEFAHILHGMMCKLFNRIGSEDRGVQCIAKSARGGVNVHSFPGGVNCLVEPFYGDNPDEAKKVMKDPDALAGCLIDGVVLWAKKVDLLK